MSFFPTIDVETGRQTGRLSLSYFLASPLNFSLNFGFDELYYLTLKRGERKLLERRASA